MFYHPLVVSSIEIQIQKWAATLFWAFTPLPYLIGTVDFWAFLFDYYENYRY